MVFIRAVSDNQIQVLSIREYGYFAFFDSLKSTRIQTLLKYRNKGFDSFEVAKDTFILDFLKLQSISEYGVLKSKIRYSSSSHQNIGGKVSYIPPPWASCRAHFTDR